MNHPKVFKLSTPLVLLCIPLVAGVCTAQPVVRSFEGDSGPGLAACESGVTHCDRPEMTMGTNGKQVVQVTWQNFRVYDTAGKLVRSTPLATFIKNAGLNPVSSNPRVPNPPVTPGPYEPTIVYNEFLERWILAVTGESDSLLVSASPDANGKWAGIYPSCLNHGQCLSFDPALHLGYDKNGVYVCGGHLGDDSPRTIPKFAYDCFSIPAGEVKGIAEGKAPEHIHREHNMPLDIYPAVDHNRTKAAAAPAFFLSKTCDRVVMGACQNSMNYPFHWVVDSFSWNGVDGKFDAIPQQEIKTGVGSKEDQWLYSKPCCGRLGTVPQAGNTAIGLRVAESHRLTNLFQFGSQLHAVLTSGPCTSGCEKQGADPGNVMFWVDLDCSNPSACVVGQTAKISGPGINPEFATVGVDAQGNVGIVAASSDANSDLSILLWSRRATDPPNTFSGPTTVVSGTQPFTCLNTQEMATIGNAVGVPTALDPLDPTRLWTTQQWSHDPARCVWNTRIVQYRIATGPGNSKKRLN